MTEELRVLVRLGYLEEATDEPSRNYAFFRLTAQGEAFLQEQEQA